MTLINVDIIKNPLNWIFVLIAVMALILVLHTFFRQPSEATL